MMIAEAPLQDSEMMLVMSAKDGLSGAVVSNHVALSGVRVQTKTLLYTVCQQRAAVQALH
jgi:hypothetical protein